MSWSAEQYTKFETERNRPILDLLAQIPTQAVKTAVDLGCGPGNSTQLLQRRFTHAIITGIDSSVDMIEAARRRLPTVNFAVEDIATWAGPGPFDVILANAALQWVPDHETLLPNLVRKLTPGGSLAIQMPDNVDEPAQRLMGEVARQAPWAGKFKEATTRLDRHSASWYYGLLASRQIALMIWRTTYYHALSGGAGAIVDWFKGTGLRPYLSVLAGADQQAYVAAYQQRIAQAYPAYRDGSVLLAIPRLFLIISRID